MTQGQTDAQHMFLAQRLQALDTGWHELRRMWESRHCVLAQAFDFQTLLRDAKQAEGFLNSQVCVCDAAIVLFLSFCQLQITALDLEDETLMPANRLLLSLFDHRSMFCHIQRCHPACKGLRRPSRNTRISSPQWRLVKKRSTVW